MATRSPLAPYNLLILPLIIFSIIVQTNELSAKTSDICLKWFKGTDAYKDPKNCGLKCVTAMTDMGTWDCVFDCDELCPESQDKMGQHNSEASNGDDKICEEIRNPSLWTKIRKFPFNYMFAKQAKHLAELAIKKAQEKYPSKKADGKVCSTIYNGIGDAFRHCYWVCLMVRTFGEKKALDYSDYREFANPDPCDEAIMDYKNNRNGAKVARSGDDCEEGCSNSDKITVINMEPICQ